MPNKFQKQVFLSLHRNCLISLGQVGGVFFFFLDVHEMKSKNIVV